MKHRLKIVYLIVSLSASCAFGQQEDLMAELADAPTKEYVSATFKSTRIINTQSVETIAANHLDFRISHRFGKLNSGPYELWGLDQSTIRLGLEYGITNRLMVGVGRSSFQKTYDGFVKYQLLKQSKGDKSFPLSVALFSSTTLNTLKVDEKEYPDYDFNNRLTYTSQLLIARKFSERLSLQVTPTYLHRNLVQTSSEPNDVYALGIGGRIKLTRRVSFNAEYTQTTQDLGSQYHNSLSIGFDIETGGHVFQLHFTNSKSMIEKGFIAETNETWDKGGVFYGFNISRVFSLKKKV